MTLPKIKEAVARLHELGYAVLAPLFNDVEGAGGAFPILDTDDRAKSPRELERAYMAAIGSAALHVVVCRDDGRVGRSAAAEGAYAATHGTARVVTAMLPSGETPAIWFSEELFDEERSALQELSWPSVDLRTVMAGTVLERCIENTARTPTSLEQSPTLIEVYERLLSDLSDLPLDH